MENLVVRPENWRNRRVFITGHTGFKGSWLTLILRSFGAEITGFSLPPVTNPSLFELLGLAADIQHIQGDIRDAAALEAAMRAAAPDVVFHLAAQPLVRQSYVDPVETYTTNVIGTVNVLEAVRQTPSVRSVVTVTTDKCYENREWPWPYRENEALGGHDPYSSSKACTEHVTASWRNSFLRASGVHVASARAGNVIGGGDWAADRLVPDFFRAADQESAVLCRSPDSIRPWQHVLEPLSGYVALAEALMERGDAAAEAWNFGPSDDDALSVGEILDYLTAFYGGPGWVRDGNPHPHEAGLLKLDSSKARQQLGWRPKWRLDRALQETVAWHRAWRSGDDMRDVTLAQIERFVASPA